jgi:hypothetical protein
MLGILRITSNDHQLGIQAPQKKIHENKRMEQDFSQGAVPSIIQ